MCKNHEQSIQILKMAHREHTYGCCPSFDQLTFANKVTPFSQLEGTFPVHNKSINQVLDRFKNYVPHDISYDVREAIYDILYNTSPEDFTDNVIRKDRFDKLRNTIKNQNQLNEHKFELIKKSSPKLSNLLMSLLKYNGIEDYQNHDLMIQFNNRGTSVMNGYELILTTEPHRVVGMSAFGRFTSCQDWIAKDEDHEYHSYTHGAWANAMDETVGVMFIREKSDEQPTEECTDVQDMLARVLVRVLPLDNGQNVIFLHRIYALSPYDSYIQDSIEEWEKNLPEGFHVVHMYRDNHYKYEKGGFTNKHGAEIKGTTRIVYQQNQDVKVYGSKRIECDNCHDGYVIETCEYCDEGYVTEDQEEECDTCCGSGEVPNDENDEECYETCPDCNGDGSIWHYDAEVECPDCYGRYEEEVRCSNCDGDGYWYDDECSEEPYNDHGEWLSFSCDEIYFYVPNYILQWNEEPKKAEIKSQTEETIEFKEGDKVIVREGINVGDCVEGVCIWREMKSNEGVLTGITLEAGDGFGHCHQVVYNDGSTLWVPTQALVKVVQYRTTLSENEKMLPIGSKVKIREDIATIDRLEMFFTGARDVNPMCWEIYAGKIATITEHTDNGKYKVDVDDEMWIWCDNCFELEKIENNQNQGVAV